MKATSLLTKTKDMVIDCIEFFYKRIYNFILLMSATILTGYYAAMVKRTIAHIITSLITGLTLFIILSKIIPTIFVFSYEAANISFLSKTDTFIFSKAEEVEGATNEYRVFACRKTPCEAQIDSMEYRIVDSLFMDTVYLTKYQIPYDPGELAGAFLGEVNTCKITWYGKRRKFLGFYPKVIGASCTVNQPME